MQEETNEKTIALYIKTGKLTAQQLQANGSLPVWSTGTTGILWVFGRQTFPGCGYGFNRAA